MKNLILRFACGLMVLNGCQSQDQSYPLVEAPVPNTAFYQGGLEAVEKRVKGNPSNPDGYYKKAIYLEAVGNTEGALAAIRQAITLDPTPDYLIKEAELHMVNGAYEQALNSVSRAQLLGGDYPDLWYLLAQLNYRKGAYTVALSQIDKALLKHPQGFNYFLTKGQIQWATHDTLSAKRSLVQASQHPDVRYQSLKLLVEINRISGNYQEAFKYLLENRQEQKGDLSLMFDQGQLLRESQQFDSALAVFTHLRKRDSNDFRLFYESGLTHFMLRRYDSALYYSEKTITLKEHYIPALLTQARVYNKRNYYTAAAKTYQTILAIDSTYAPAVEEYEKLSGKIAYLQRIQRNRERNADLRILTPKSTNENNQ